MATRIVVLMAVCTALFMSACRPVMQVPDGSASGDVPDQLTQVKIGVGFVPNVQFAPIYVAIDKGFYVEEGLDVGLEYGFENDYLKLVGVDELQFMIGSGDQVILGRAQGLPVRYVMTWYTRFPVVLVATADAGIREFGDMAGKRIGLPGTFGANYVAFRAMLEAGGLSEADVKMESIGFTQAAAISEGTVDAAIDYAANGPVVLSAAGHDIVTIGPDAYGDLPANGLVTNERTLAGDPELVRRMVAATRRGIDYSLAYPDDAFAIALKTVPEAGGENSALNRAVFDASLDYWRTPEQLQPGAAESGTWEAAVALMQRMGLIDAAVPTSELYTNDYLP